MALVNVKESERKNARKGRRGKEKIAKRAQNDTETAMDEFIYREHYKTVQNYINRWHKIRI